MSNKFQDPDKPMPDEPAALGRLLSEDPRLELREQRFPVRAIVLAVIFGNVGETTIPIEPAAARSFAEDLVRRWPRNGCSPASRSTLSRDPAALPASRQKSRLAPG
jgi:hypothetical protein